MTNDKPNPFTLIKHAGEPNKATFEGIPITRQANLYADEWGMVPCTPYDTHFVFAVPGSRLRLGMWEHFCTCGSPAVIANPHSDKGRIFVCYFYHSRLLESGHGYHQTTVINKDSFDEVAGQTIEIPETTPKWLI